MFSVLYSFSKTLYNNTKHIFFYFECKQKQKIKVNTGRLMGDSYGKRDRAICRPIQCNLVSCSGDGAAVALFTKLWLFT